ncbi:MAG: ATP-binding protein, partial [Bacteroidota bacterium]
AMPANPVSTSSSILKLIPDQYGNVWVAQISRLLKISPPSAGDNFSIAEVEWSGVLDKPWIPKSREAYLQGFVYGKVLDNHVFTICDGKDGSIWLRTLDGIGKWQEEQQRFDFRPLAFDYSDKKQSPFAGTGNVMGEDDEGRLWMGGVYAMVVYDIASGQIVERLEVESAKSQQVFYPNIRSWFQDRGGNYWIGSRGNGLYFYSPHRQRFRSYTQSINLEGLSIRSIHQTRDGVLWFGDTGARFYSWNRRQAEGPRVIENWFSNLIQEKNTFGYVLSMHEDEAGNLWAGCQYRLFKIKQHQGIIQDLQVFPLKNGQVDIFDIHEDKTGQLWLITNREFGPFDETTGTLNGIPYLQNSRANYNPSGTPMIYEDPQGDFWLATTEGLKKYERESQTFTHYTSDPAQPYSISSDFVKSICPDPIYPDSILWLGTNNGLNRFDVTHQTFQRFLKSPNGLPDNVVYGILPDESGYLWISTNQGLSRFNPVAETFDNFTKSDGLQDNEFNSGAYFRGANGELFFGGIEGFNNFFPAQIKSNRFVPPIVVTQCVLANSILEIDATGPLKSTIHLAPQIELSFQDKVIALEFSALDYTDPLRNQFAYKLEPFQKEWQPIGTRREVTFTNLDPGRYTFWVKGSNSDGYWNEQGTSVDILINPPWWRTKLAYVSYALGILGLLYGIYRFQLARQLDRAETKRLAELDALKTRLYTNITHEFRTPLTVILGMANQVKGQEKTTRLIKQNGENLLRLINQMLDLSKLEKGKLGVQVQQGNIIPYLNYLTESFYSMAQQKEIRLVFYSEMSSLMMDFDEVKIQHIVYNLLSNAIKFTPSGGKIIFHADTLQHNDAKHLLLKVQDNGIGIAAEELPYVFDRFHQADNSIKRKGEGTGIGLALTKELVTLLGGSIQLESEVNVGTTFSILLPITTSAELGEISGVNATT